jgi:hypothetical protein
MEKFESNLSQNQSIVGGEVEAPATIKNILTTNDLYSRQYEENLSVLRSLVNEVLEINEQNPEFFDKQLTSDLLSHFADKDGLTRTEMELVNRLRDRKKNLDQVTNKSNIIVKLIDSQTKALSARDTSKARENKQLTETQIKVFMASVFQVVKLYVNDPEKLGRLTLDVRKLYQNMIAMDENQHEL